MGDDTIDRAANPIPDQQPDIDRVERPWGVFEQYAHNEAVTVSLMVVKPGERLSLQSHTGRAELWVALDDGAIVQVGEEVLRLSTGEKVWIPPETKHRLSAAGSETTRVLEVAFGNWQQEDITRYEDDYDRLGHCE